MGEFSLDDQRCYHGDRRGLKFYRDLLRGRDQVNVDFDLDLGMDKVQRKDEEEQKNERLGERD